MNWAAITAIGTVFVGLALPLAFVQLAALRQDRLRVQVSRVGVWTGALEEAGEDPGAWTIPVLIRNGSELPVRVDSVDVSVRIWGFGRVLAAPEGTTEVDYYPGDRDDANLAPGTIAPGETRRVEYAYQASIEFPYRPRPKVARAVITDAAGYQWEMRLGKAGPARRVQPWRCWWWKRHGHL